MVRYFLGLSRKLLKINKIALLGVFRQRSQCCSGACLRWPMRTLLPWILEPSERCPRRRGWPAGGGPRSWRRRGRSSPLARPQRLRLRSDGLERHQGANIGDGADSHSARSSPKVFSRVGLSAAQRRTLALSSKKTVRIRHNRFPFASLSLRYSHCFLPILRSCPPSPASFPGLIPRPHTWCRSPRKFQHQMEIAACVFYLLRVLARPMGRSGPATLRPSATFHAEIARL